VVPAVTRVTCDRQPGPGGSSAPRTGSSQSAAAEQSQPDEVAPFLAPIHTRQDHLQKTLTEHSTMNQSNI